MRNRSLTQCCGILMVAALWSIPLEGMLTQESAWETALLNDSDAPAIFPSREGRILFEAENRPEFGEGWTVETTADGYAGTGYLEFFSGSGDESTRQPLERYGQTYHFAVNEPGEYSFHFRTAAPDITEHNDAWVAFPDGIAYRVQRDQVVSLGSEPFKLYHNESNDRFNWTTQTVDFTPWRIRLEFPHAGLYRVNLYGRSTRFKVDRFAIVKRPLPDWPSVLDLHPGHAPDGFPIPQTEGSSLLLEFISDPASSSVGETFSMALEDPLLRSGDLVILVNGKALEGSRISESEYVFEWTPDRAGRFAITGFLMGPLGPVARSETRILEIPGAPVAELYLGGSDPSLAERMLHRLLEESHLSVILISPGEGSTTAPEDVALKVYSSRFQGSDDTPEPLDTPVLVLSQELAETWAWIDNPYSSSTTHFPGQAILDPYVPQLTGKRTGAANLSRKALNFAHPVQPALRSAFSPSSTGAAILAWEDRQGMRQRRAIAGFSEEALAGLLTPGYRALRGLIDWLLLEEDPSPWWQKEANPEIGFRVSEWLGPFHEMDTKWLFSNNLGWFRGENFDATSGGWLYNLDLGWFWTSSRLYPYLFVSERNTWFWNYRDNNPNLRRYHDIGNNRIESYP